MINAVYYEGERDMSKFVPVDEWEANEEEKIFKTCKGHLRLPVSEYFGMPSGGDLDYFILSTKRCYNGDEMRFHLPHYMNYFEKFYDQDHELLMVMIRLKYMIDFEQSYTVDNFLYDINMYLFQPSLLNKAHAMNEDNYKLELDNKKYRNDKNPSLTYKDRHAKVLMWMSLLMNMVIPLATHYIFVQKLEGSNAFLLRLFDTILHMTDINIYNKLYETCSSNIYKSTLKEKTLWDMQSIRSKNPTTHTISSAQNIILNIMPKYTYDKNIIYFNYASIKQSNNYQVINIGYEYDYISLSNAKRDAENNSVFDRFESYLIKQNEGLFLQNKVSAQETMKTIDLIYGPFDEAEINYYIKRLEDDDGNIINKFQKDLIFNLFYKHFGDPQSINAINKIDYVKLMIAASNQLSANHMIILPYIISSKVEKIQAKKNICKKEMTKLVSSKFYNIIKDKYRNEKIELYILSCIATILSSDFKIIDYYDDEIDGTKTKIIPEIVSEEILMYVTLI